MERTHEEISFANGQTIMGSILVASSERGIVSILLGDDRNQLIGDLQSRFPEAHLFPGDRTDKEFVNRIAAYLKAPGRDLDLPLDIRGTPFQKRVWRAVREIPFAQTTTYTEIARKVQAPKAMRAVGNACAKNWLAIVIPCHRVLRSDGSFPSGRHGALIKGEEAALLKIKPALERGELRRKDPGKPKKQPG